MRTKKEIPSIKEQKEKGEGYFIYKKIPEGQMGVVKSYGEKVLQKLAEIVPNIEGLQRLPTEGRREKYIGQIKTKKGLLKFIIKQKNRPEQRSPYRRDLDEVFAISVMHEIVINLETRKKYKEKYHEDLPLENPIGFFIAKNGDRFVIHEFIKNLTPVPYDNRQLSAFMSKVARRFMELNILPEDFDQRHVRGQKVGGKTKFWIIDTELWKKWPK